MEEDERIRNRQIGSNHQKGTCNSIPKIQDSPKNKYLEISNLFQNQSIESIMNRNMNYDQNVDIASSKQCLEFILECQICLFEIEYQDNFCSNCGNIIEKSVEYDNEETEEERNAKDENENENENEERKDEISESNQNLFPTNQQNKYNKSQIIQSKLNHSNTQNQINMYALISIPKDEQIKLSKVLIIQISRSFSSIFGKIAHEMIGNSVSCFFENENLKGRFEETLQKNVSVFKNQKKMNFTKETFLFQNSNGNVIGVEADVIFHVSEPFRPLDCFILIRRYWNVEDEADI